MKLQRLLPAAALVFYELHRRRVSLTIQVLLASSLAFTLFEASLWAGSHWADPLL